MKVGQPQAAALTCTHAPRWTTWAWVLAAGYAHALSIAWPFSSWLPWGWTPGQASGGLQVASLAVLVWRLQDAVDNRRAGYGAALGWVFASAMLTGTFWWLYISMHDYGGLPAPLAVAAVLALAMALAVYYALAAGLYVALAPRGALARATVWASLWLLAELARVKFFTGFPWGEGGYAHVDGWARPLAGWVGVHGLTWLAAWVAAGLVTWLAAGWAARRVDQNGTRRPFWLAGGLGSVAWGLSCLAPVLPAVSDGTPARQTLSVTLLQGNIAQDIKFQPSTGILDALQFYGAQLQQATTDLVILPETAFPLLPSQLPAGYWAALQARFASGEQAALIGMPLGSPQEGYSNSVLGLKPGVAVYRYDKHHLVPFGEFVPPLFQWFIRLMDIPLGDFKRGSLDQPPFEWRGERLAPNICYEDLFGEEIGAQFKSAANAPTLLVNISNIAWFGNTVAIDQHLNISRMRALEFARPMLRATNTGATVVINAQGQVTHALERHTRGALVAQVQGVDGLTFHARWVSRLGLLPWWGLGLAVVALAAWRRRLARQALAP